MHFNAARVKAMEADQVSEKYPALAQGRGMFQWAYPACASVEAGTPAESAHSDYLQALAAVGIVGLARLLRAFGPAWRVALRNLRAAEDPPVNGIGLGTIGALTAIALHEMTDFALYIPAGALTAALVVGLNLRARRMGNDEER